MTQDKRIALVTEMINTANNIAGIAKLLPNESKNRNIFKKDFSRKPSKYNKRKVGFKMQLGMLQGLINAKMIIETPTPKFKEGESYGIHSNGLLALKRINNSSEEVFFHPAIINKKDAIATSEQNQKTIRENELKYLASLIQAL